MSSTEHPDDLKQRVQRVESELEALRDYHTATDEEGNEWSVTKLVTELDLSRRQALYVIVALAGGTSLINALTDVTSAQASSGTLYVDQIGDSNNRVSDLYVDTTHNLNDTSTLQNDIDGQGFDITNLGSIGADEANGVQYASNLSSDDLPDLQTAFDNAGDSDVVVLVPGEHDVSSTIEQNTNFIHFIQYGTLVKQADVVALEFNRMTAWTAPGRGVQAVSTDVSDTTNGIEYRDKVTMAGFAEVNGVGGHGHYIIQDGAGVNTNGSMLRLAAFNCGDDGIRVENTTADPPDINGMDIVVNDSFSNGGWGLNHVDGFNNYVRLMCQQNSSGGVRCDSRENIFEIRNSEAHSSGTSLVFDTNSHDNAARGDIQNGFTDNGEDNLVEVMPGVRSVREMDADADAQSREYFWHSGENRPKYQDQSGTMQPAVGFEKIFDQTVSVPSSGTVSEDIGNQLGEALIGMAVPANDPNNDHAYGNFRFLWLDGSGITLFQADELEGEGGGEARVVVWRL